MKKYGLLGCLGALILFALIVGSFGIGTYNRIVGLDQSVKSQWAQVENAYQRRYDLIPNLVKTVQGAADFEKSTLQAVVEARSRVGQVAAAPAAGSPSAGSNAQSFREFESAQAGLSSALSRLLIVVEQYPNLKSNQNFLELQSQLEGTENRISVERRRFNEVAEGYNTAIKRFPANLIAGLSGFQPREYFKGTAGSDKAPDVNFDFNKKP